LPWSIFGREGGRCWSELWKFRGGAQGSPFLSVEIFLETLIWSNINQFLESSVQQSVQVMTEEEYYLWSN